MFQVAPDKLDKLDLEPKRGGGDGGTTFPLSDDTSSHLT